MVVVVVPLYRHGSVAGHAVVDAVDLDRIGRHTWRLNTSGYAECTIRGNGDSWYVGMHRLVLGLARGDGLEGDHENGNRLDNRRRNLRVVTHAQNCQNVRGHTGRSGYRGVSWHRAAGKWRAYVMAAGRQISGGYHEQLPDAIDAAAALRREHLPFAVPEAS